MNDFYCNWSNYFFLKLSWIIISRLIVLTVWWTISILWKISWISSIWRSFSVVITVRWLLPRGKIVIWKWFSWINIIVIFLFGISCFFSFIDKLIHLVINISVVCSEYSVVSVYIHQYYAHIYGNSYTIFWMMGFSRRWSIFEWFFWLAQCQRHECYLVVK